MPLEGERLIHELTLLPAEQIPINPERKNSIVDIKCTDTKGRQFVVEMQMAWNKGFKPRSLFNTAKAYVRQLGKGYKYTQLKPVYMLCLINDTFHKNSEECYHPYTFIRFDDLEDRLGGMTIIYIELPKFKPQSFSDKKMAVLWLRFLTEVKDKDDAIQKIPEELVENEHTAKALDILEESSYSKAELKVYEDYWDAVSIEKDSLEGALEKGRKEGIEKGIEKGKIESVLGLHKNGVSIVIISKSLNISEKQVREIIKSGRKH